MATPTRRPSPSPAAPTRRPSPSPASLCSHLPTDHPLDWMCRSAGQRKPSPPAPGRARPAGWFQRGVRAEGQQSRNQGKQHSLGVKATASLLQGPRWFCPQNGAKPTGHDPDPPSLFPGGQHHRREAWASLPGRVRVSVAAREARSEVPAQGLPRGGGQPWLGTTAPWWTGRGWRCPHSDGVQRPIL